MTNDQLDIFNQYRYHFRYRNGNVSQGYWNDFETAVKAFNDCKHSGRYADLYFDLMDVVPREVVP